MNSTERVKNVLLGKEVDRQPIYGWVSANLSDPITRRFGSVAAFEDKYEFDMAHIFGGPGAYDKNKINALKSENEELTPDILLENDFFGDVDNVKAYDNVRRSLEHHKARDRFCYVQTPGFFESFNNVFGIENQLMYLAMYPDEIRELYKRQAEWNIRFADHCIDAGVDMVHISDDWGSQKDLLFSPSMWDELIHDPFKKVVDHIHGRGVFASLHSDGCIEKVTDRVAEMSIDMVHPWQESAGMSYDTYLSKYGDKFAILGGVCVQTAIGIMSIDKLENEIRRVFAKLKGSRWICCTSHFVQEHCTMDDLERAYDIIYKLAR